VAQWTETALFNNRLVKSSFQHVVEYLIMQVVNAVCTTFSEWDPQTLCLPFYAFLYFWIGVRNEKSRSNQEFFNQVLDEPLLQISKI
jgi:F0F1-type ATP synthase membrane subunit a